MLGGEICGCVVWLFVRCSGCVDVFFVVFVVFDLDCVFRLIDF